MKRKLSSKNRDKRAFQSPKKKKKAKSVDEFLNSGLNSSDDSEVNSEPDEQESSDGEGGEIEKPSQHKASLERLKQQDPEFYQFLATEDRSLLNFQDSDSSEEDEERGGTFHQPPQKLEIASDEEKDEEELEDATEQPAAPVSKAKVNVTMAKLDKWAKQLQHNSPHAVHEVVQAFQAAVRETSGSGMSEGRYRVEGSQVFNGVVRVCVRDLIPAVNHILQLPKNTDALKPVLPSTSRQWHRVRIDVKVYITDLIKLMSNLSEANVLNVILKHVHSFIHYAAVFPKLTKLMLKQLIGVWSSGEESSRVLAFLSISRLIRIKKDSLLQPALKLLYMAYMRNCKFTSPSTLPLINFMQRSLVEVLAIDTIQTYQYAFIYIRQLAISLRNAIVTKKKEAVQAVYNWQFIHSLNLWAKMLGTLHPNPTLQPLIYPLTQVVVGTIKLVPSTRYLPLRFHCVRVLNSISSTTGTFIPVLPFLLEVLQLVDFNKKHAKTSMKPFTFACILKLSGSQLSEKAFREGVLDQLYELFIEHLHTYSHTVCFPELALPAQIQLKSFMKSCKVANFTRQMKLIVDKIEETSKVITQRRRTGKLDLCKSQTIDLWEAASKEQGTPISKYYSNWRKMRDRELQVEIAGKESGSMDKIPTMKRTKPEPATQKEKETFADLFKSDSEDDQGEELLAEPKAKKKKGKDATDSSEEYSDFDSDELEILAGSADEDEEEADDSEEEDKEDDEEVEEEETDEAEEDDEESGSDQDDIVEDLVMSDED